MIESDAQARAYVQNIADGDAMERLDALTTALSAENERQNLVAKATLENMWTRHIADSAQVLKHVPRETSGPWMDLGAGAGFPGLVLAVLRSQQPVILVESRGKRVEWLSRMVEELALENCAIDGRRLELIEPLKAGVITARAFAPLPKLLSLSAPFSTSRTRWVLPKGRSAAQEVATLPRKVQEMFHVEQSLTDREAGIIVGTGRIPANMEFRR